MSVELHPKLRMMETVVPINLVNYFNPAFSCYGSLVAEASNQATYQQLTRILDTLLRSGGDLLDVNGLLRGIEFAHQHHML
jgi:hypothetical protein